MKTYMFLVLIESANRVGGYYTNTIMSKNDGALVTFRDENGFMQSFDPATVRILMNVDYKTHLAKSL